MRLNKLYRVVWISLGWAFALPVFAQSLEQAIVHAVRTSPDLLISEADRKAADSRLSLSYSAYLPSLDLSASYGRDRNTTDTTRAATGGSKTLTKRETSFTLQQMLFDGFSAKHAVEERANRVKEAAEDVAGTLEDVSLRVVESYLEVIRRRILVDYAKASLVNHQQIHRQIELRAESGIGRKSDLDQVLGRLALARSNLMTEQANLRDAEATYIRVVGNSPSSLIRPKGPTKELPVTEDAAVALAIENHPQLLAANAAVDASRSSHKAAKASYYPALNFILSGSDTKNKSGSETTTDNLTADLQLSYNVFRGGADRARERETAWLLEQAKETRNQIRRQVEQSIRISWNGYTSAKAQLKYLKQHQDATQRTLDAYQSQFKIGQRTLLDLLDSENELFRSKTSYISGQFTELLGRYRVLNSMGTLMAYLNVEIPETATY